MALLSILALGMLSLSSVALRSMDSQSADQTARANARLALSLAIGELQKHAGSDKRVTGRADLLDQSVGNPMWTAVWNSAGGVPAYLVSGNGQPAIDLKAMPTTYPTGYNLPGVALEEQNSVVVFGTGLTSPEQVRVPLIGIRGEGAYAYWVSDEGVKARFRPCKFFSVKVVSDFC